MFFLILFKIAVAIIKILEIYDRFGDIKMISIKSIKYGN